MSFLRTALVFGAGYVLGTRAGHERYEQIKAGAQKVWESKPVRKGRGAAKEQAEAAYAAAKEQAKDSFATAQDKAKEAFAAASDVAAEKAHEAREAVKAKMGEKENGEEIKVEAVPYDA
ncbi:putative membrane protein [Arcanobacterium wilhelmae]|uniref:Membrane protein n=1 Tax=Arcanobacterium wilhelmae TaxID=1803177 RepID=A0ABT9NC23_9ACTO|nr:hypothetical protein [Arcanobacterium wilhelmae]MDP9801048.1 putative membrane protein [Arcanobacterium wilhelmae]WFN90405.1 hypothetical protein P8A24_00650 [Arcanobacterium wilhelmae]